MPLTTLRDVHTALLAVVQGINGSTGGYTHSFTGKVVSRGGVNPADGIPCASVVFNGRPASDGPELGDIEARETFQVNAFAPLVSGVSDNPDGRIQSGEAMMEDIEKALHANRSLGGLVNTLIVRDVAAIDGQELDANAPYGLAVLVVETARYRESVG
jgi:hypothetical protein